MNKELILALEALEKENGISKDIMLDTIEKSLREEFKQEFNTVDNCEVTLDRVTGDFHIYQARRQRMQRRARSLTFLMVGRFF